MSQPANVRSISALVDFRATLATFDERAKRALDEIDLEIRRAQEWIGIEQPAFWKSETQRALDLVAQRRNELEQCERKSLDGQRPSCYEERKALDAAKRYVRYVDEKIDAVRRWAQKIEREVADYQAQISKFRAMLDGDVPKSLSVLERMITALEAYAAIPVVPAAGPGAQEEPPAVARALEEDEPKAKPSIFQQLREHTPSAEKREAVEVRSLVDPQAEADHDESSHEQAALKTAYDLHLQPALPGWQEKVVLLAGCLDQGQVYVERVEAVEDDSGWFIAPIEPDLGSTPEYQAVEIGELMQLRPGLIKAFALPPGYLAVFSNDELVAVLNEDGVDRWQPPAERTLDNNQPDSDETGES